MAEPEEERPVGPPPEEGSDPIGEKPGPTGMPGMGY